MAMQYPLSLHTTGRYCAVHSVSSNHISSQFASSSLQSPTASRSTSFSSVASSSSWNHDLPTPSMRLSIRHGRLEGPPPLEESILPPSHRYSPRLVLNGNLHSTSSLHPRSTHFIKSTYPNKEESLITATFSAVNSTSLSLEIFRLGEDHRPQVHLLFK